jgi:hypothetical protein
MQRRVKIILLFLVIIFFSPGYSLQFLDTSEIKPGMQGIGKSVFEGTKISEFEVEILGVLKNVGPKFDLILARLKNPLLEEAGVIAGMSGSPVYINDKLIGAVAFTWSFTKEPIAGITPIKKMLEIFEKKPLLDKQTYWFLGPEEEGRNVKIVPVKTPIMASGFHSGALRKLDAWFGEMGMFTVPVGGMGDEVKVTSPELKPGAAVGIELMSGDISLTGIGTLTYRDGDKLLAFGHGLFLSGPVAIPLTGGYVHTIMKSQYRSFKFTSPTVRVGMINQDRETGIAGTVGKEAPLTSVEVNLEERNKFNFRIIRNKFLAPGLFMVGLFNSFLSEDALFGERTTQVKTNILLSTGETLTIKNTYFSLFTPLDMALVTAYPLKLLLFNEFKPVEIEKVSVTLATIEKARVAIIEKLWLNKKEVKRGEEVKLKVFIRPYRERVLIKEVSLKIPLQVPPGKVFFQVTSEALAQFLEAQRVPSKFQPKNFTELLDLLKLEARNNLLVIKLISKTQAGLGLRGEELPNLPLSILGVMTSQTQAGEVQLARRVVFLEEELLLPYVISGVKFISLNVKSK